MKDFLSYVPPKSSKLLQCWVDELNVNIKLTAPRQSKLGDFQVKDNKFYITINYNLNQYSFLITLTHELAHAFVFKKYQYELKPHSKSWQLTFKALMLNFLNLDCFPDDILKVLSLHMIKPKASTFSDLNLVKVLMQYDKNKVFTLSDLSLGDVFSLASGRTFIKGKILRKRIKCIEKSTDKYYSLHPFTEVIIKDKC